MAKIFESPDGGKTLYARDFGSAKRELHQSDPNNRSMWDRIQEDKLWGRIRELAKTEPALQEELNRVIIVYNLLKKHD